jgi:acyl carrier protein
MPTEEETTAADVEAEAKLKERDKKILTALREIINEETGVEKDKITLSKKFVEDLDIDSLSMMTIVVNAEEKFEIRIPDDDVKDLKTPKDVIDYVKKAQDEKA